ncbi:MAG: hypothetical protein JWN41_977 [Thermoleophilia bacterium]|nr:hypothetical protein [Thermoleophilia bacterium]
MQVAAPSVARQLTTPRPSIVDAHTMQPHWPGPPNASMDCTPAATLTALRMIGANTPPGHDHDIAAIDSLRLLATGNAKLAADHTYDLYPSELAPVVERIGAHASISSSIDTLLAAAAAGSPVVASGNGRVLARQAEAPASAPYLAHSITIGTRDAATGGWLVSDPSRREVTSVSDELVYEFLQSTPPGFANPPEGASTYPALIVSRSEVSAVGGVEPPGGVAEARRVNAQPLSGATGPTGVGTPQGANTASTTRVPQT